MKCDKCAHYHDEWCEMANGEPDEVAIRECGCFRARSNVDRVRAMSDEELMEMLYRLYRLTMEKDGGDIARLWCDGKSGCIDEHGEIECDEERHKACILRWLKGPADDE